MVRNNCLFFVLMFSTLNYACFGQRNISIDIKAYNTGMTKLFFLTINKKEDSIYVKYKLLDSVSVRMDTDSFYESTRLLLLGLSRQTKEDEYSAKMLHNRMDSIEQLYSFFTVDSLSMHANGYWEYTKLLKTVCRATKQELEHPDPNEIWVVADGAPVVFIINDGRKTKKVRAISPRKDSHPVLNDLLTRSFDLFRDGNGTKKLSGTSKTIGW